MSRLRASLPRSGLIARLSLIVLGFFAIGLLLLGISRKPGVDEMLQNARPQIAINLVSPSPPAVYPANAAIHVRAEVLSQENLAMIELWADGVPIHHEAETQSTGPLLHASWTWTPETTGDHLLVARVENTLGEAALSSALRITAVEAIGSQLYLPIKAGEDPAAVAFEAGRAGARLYRPATETPTPTAEATVTQTPTPTATATALPPELANPTFSTDSFHFLENSCQPRASTIEIQGSPPEEIYSVVVFLRFVDSKWDRDSGWDSGHAMNPSGNGFFSYTVTLEGFSIYADRIQMQIRALFVATDAEGREIARSPIYDQLMLTTCMN
jgi:hypothetical protein